MRSRSTPGAIDATPSADGRAPPAPPRRWHGVVGVVPLSVGVLAVPGLVAVVRLFLAAQRPFDFFGDEAILESSVRHVGDQLVGPYSRFGFRQPGPAYYYLQAPFYRLVGGSAGGLFLGAFCINLAAAIGCVLVVRRFLGETAARWSAVVVGALLVCLTPALLSNPWNPYVLALPVLLTVVLAAAAASGSAVAAVGAAVVGSFVVQTHLAAAATLAAALATAAAVGLAVRLRRRRAANGEAAVPRPSRPARRRATAVVGVATVLLVLMWVPPLVEEATRSPGNLTRLARFFSASHPEFDRGVDHGLEHTAGQVAAQLTVMPFGHDRGAQPTNWARVFTTAVGLVIAGTVTICGWRKQRPVIAALGAIAVVGPAAAIWSGTRIVGEVFPYLLIWTSGLLLPGLIAAGQLLPSRLARLAAVAAMTVGLTLTWTMARHSLVPYPTSADVAGVADLARPWLADTGARRVRIRIAQHDRWPVATGLAVRLEKNGVRTTVDHDWTFLFGDHFRPTGDETAEVWLAEAAGGPPEPGRLTRLGIVGATSVWAGLVAVP